MLQACWWEIWDVWLCWTNFLSGEQERGVKLGKFYILHIQMQGVAGQLFPAFPFLYPSSVAPSPNSYSQRINLLRVPQVIQYVSWLLPIIQNLTYISPEQDPLVEYLTGPQPHTPRTNAGQTTPHHRFSRKCPSEHRQFLVSG